MSKHLDIYLRAHTEKYVDQEKKSRSRKNNTLPDRWPERCLIFDTETRTDVHQKLICGFARICKLVEDRYICERETIIYSGAESDAALSSAAVLDKSELNAIGTFVLNTHADIEVKRFPPQVRLEVVRSFPEFLQKVFWPAVRRGYGIVGFNLPFDIGRFALDWNKSRKDGFSLVLTKQLEHKTQTWKPHPYRPPIVIEAKDARTAFIKRGTPRFRRDEWPHPLRAIDLSVLLYSLFDKHMSLDDWCAYFRDKGYKIDRKLDHEPSGRVTQAELRYCRQDVKVTHQLLNAAMQEFSRHPLPNLLPERAYSPALISKQYMREMGIVRPIKNLQEQLTNEINAIPMQAC